MALFRRAKPRVCKECGQATDSREGEASIGRYGGEIGCFCPACWREFSGFEQLLLCGPIPRWVPLNPGSEVRVSSSAAARDAVSRLTQQLTQVRPTVAKLATARMAVFGIDPVACASREDALRSIGNQVAGDPDRGFVWLAGSYGAGCAVVWQEILETNGDRVDQKFFLVDTDNTLYGFYTYHH